MLQFAEIEKIKNAEGLGCSGGCRDCGACGVVKSGFYHIDSAADVKRVYGALEYLKKPKDKNFRAAGQMIRTHDGGQAMNTGERTAEQARTDMIDRMRTQSRTPYYNIDAPAAADTSQDAGGSPDDARARMIARMQKDSRG